MGTTIYVCATCRHEDGEKYKNDRTGGDVFHDHIAAAAEGTGVTVEQFECLGACKRHCNSAVMAPGKMTFVLGEYAPTSENAETVVGFAVKHAESETGLVPLKERPEGIRGHVIARTPPQS